MYGQSYRILVAVHPDAVDRVRRILGGHDLREVKTVDEAKASLVAEKVDFVFLGARFDESRMFEFLEYLRRHEQHRNIPVAACILAPTTMTQTTIEGLADTAKLYGAREFINLNDFADEPAENRRVRLLIETVLAN